MYFALGTELIHTIKRKKIMAVQYASSNLARTERSFSTSEHKHAAVIFSLKKLQPYLLDAPLVVDSDHEALRIQLDNIDIFR